MASALVEADELLDQEEVARRLGVSVQWVQKQARKDALPSIRVGRFYRFYWPDVLDRLRG